MLRLCNRLSREHDDMDPDNPPAWAFLTYHARALVCIAHDPGSRLRDISSRIGITERATQRILGELAS